MVIALFLMRLLEVLFFLGIAGSSVVVAISFVEDMQELFGDEHPHVGSTIDETR